MEWRPVIGWESEFEVSEYGDVRRIKDSTNGHRAGALKAPVKWRGYIQIVLCKNGKHKTFRAHQLVAGAFIGPCPKGMEVNHKDGTRDNNHYSNLEYVTHSGNLLHATRQLRRKSKGGEAAHRAKTTVKQVEKAREMIAKGISKIEIAKHFGMSNGWAYDIANGVTWRNNNDPIVKIKNPGSGTPRGASHWSAKFTDADIIAIRKARAAGAKTTELGRKYGVTPAYISLITNGKIWKHLPLS